MTRPKPPPARLGDPTGRGRARGPTATIGRSTPRRTVAREGDTRRGGPPVTSPSRARRAADPPPPRQAAGARDPRAGPRARQDRRPCEHAEGQARAECSVRAGHAKPLAHRPARPAKDGSQLLPRGQAALRRPDARARGGEPGRIGLRSPPHQHEHRGGPGADAVHSLHVGVVRHGGKHPRPPDAILGAANYHHPRGAPATSGRALPLQP